jgi:hypothetical protein
MVASDHRRACVLERCWHSVPGPLPASAYSSPAVLSCPVRPQTPGLGFRSWDEAAYFRHSNSIVVPGQGIEVSGLTEIALLATGQVGQLNVYPPLTTHLLKGPVRADCFYPVEHLFLQIGISIQITCFLIESSSVTKTEKIDSVSFI